MRKLVIVSSFFEETLGGISTFVKNYHEEIGKNYDVELITPDIQKEKKGVIKISTSKIKNLKEIFFRLLKTKPEIIHINGPWYYLFPAIMYKIFKNKVKVFQTIHTQPKLKLKGIKYHMYAYLLNNTDKVISVSRNMEKDITKIFGIKSKKICTIHNGINIDKKTRKKNHKFIKQILSVSNFAHKEKTKGALCLVKAINLTNNVQLKIVGGGKYKYILKDYIQNMKLQDKVILEGFQKDVNKFYQTADIFCHITNQDALPYVIFEAMAYNLPIVASNTGGIPEIFDNNPKYIIQNNPKLIADKINKIIKVGIYSENYDAYSSNFTWKKCTQKYMDVFEYEIQKSNN